MSILHELSVQSKSEVDADGHQIHRTFVRLDGKVLGGINSLQIYIDPVRGPVATINMYVDLDLTMSGVNKKTLERESIQFLAPGPDEI